MTEYELDEWNRSVSEEELLADLQRVAQHLNRTPTYDLYDEHGRFASRTLWSRFGGWNAALQRAGLPVNRRSYIPDEELFENIERVWTSLGRQPKRSDMVAPLSDFGKTTYEKRFGGWRRALEAFIAYMNQEDVGLSPPSRDDRDSGTSRRSTPRFPSLRMRFRILRRDHFSCRVCGRSPAQIHGLELHIDHVRPYSTGGETTMDNLQTLCKDCNLGKSDGSMTAG